MFTLTFETTNAAFDQEGLYTETARILREVAERVEAGKPEGVVRDANGNPIGTYKVEQD